MKRLLITGSSGELGEALARHLSKDFSVVGLDIASGPQTTCIGSIVDPNLVMSLTKGIDAIIHTASLHAPHVSLYPPEKFEEVNIRGTSNLLEASVENGIKRFVYTSTTSLYGHSMDQKGKTVWVTENLPPVPRDIYDKTKIAAENLCKNKSEKHGLPCISLRVSRFFKEPDELMFFYRFYRGVDLKDVVKAHELALKFDLTGYEVVNISSNSPFKKTDLEELYYHAPDIMEKYFPQLKKILKKRGWDIPSSIDRVYVINKARKVLGYDPDYNFNEFLKKEIDGN